MPKTRSIYHRPEQGEGFYVRVVKQPGGWVAVKKAGGNRSGDRSRVLRLRPDDATSLAAALIVAAEDIKAEEEEGALLP